MHSIRLRNVSRWLLYERILFAICRTSVPEGICANASLLEKAKIHALHSLAQCRSATVSANPTHKVSH
ncbi:hypothetical protein MGA5115_02050 [Marinomonas gallaica]|uniref:Uncharacterized protein n=1 Tax=Marinomonas gallaica TaxID=1806667 RepID=A0A1C3JRU8_9GAMM|nr:hypothetical protein MGA5115_02050 [Marinomonas gallaica]SBT20767.1 hypothetical protein MGA5116_01354 [Marinomonas gallaica]